MKSGVQPWIGCGSKAGWLAAGPPSGPRCWATPEPTSWDSVWSGDQGDKVSIYDSADYIADAALRLMGTNPELKITNPYQLNDEQFAEAIKLLEAQRDAGAQYWALYTDQMASYAPGHVVTGTS